MIDYTPVMLSVDHPHPELEKWVVDRFERLNGRRPIVIRREDLPREALLGHYEWAKAWIWDVVPNNVNRIMFLDYDIVPLRPFPPDAIPDVPFAACLDNQGQLNAYCALYPVFDRGGGVFNGGFFIARRDTRPSFDILKSFLTVREDTSFAGRDEQIVLNHLIQATVGVHWLPQHYHWLASLDVPLVDRSILMHPCGKQDARWPLMHTLRSALGLELIGEQWATR